MLERTPTEDEEDHNHRPASTDKLVKSHPLQRGGTFSMNVDKKHLEWLNKQVENGEFDNVIAGIRRCILIAQRVYETTELEEMLKFIHGRKPK